MWPGLLPRWSDQRGSSTSWLALLAVLRLTLQIVTKTIVIGVTLMLASFGAASATPIDVASAAGRPAVGIHGLSEPGRVLYTADWSTGLDGWAGSGDWKTLRGVLLNDGTSGSRTPILAPARIATLTDNRYLDGGLTGLVSYGYQLEVSSFRIIQVR
jgi:hypothetical protein